uniref:Uncharacterized protein n=1 Tax=Amphimedon queenslandica TaxID=400682 RepID=A0A1X7VX16_AMPQE
MIVMEKNWNTLRKSSRRNSHTKGNLSITISFHKGNLSITISFHKSDPDWEDYVEIEKGTILHNKDKLKVVVVPQIISARQSAESPIHGDCGSVQMPGLGARHYLSFSTPSGSFKPVF